MAPLGYVLRGPDNGSHMCGSAEALDDIPGLAACPSCGYKTDFAFSNPRFVTKQRSYDFSYTYDGAAIVSLKFREHCARIGYDGLRFVPFEHDQAFFQFLIEPIVAFDAQRRRTRFEKLCPTCGYFESVVGSKPCYLKAPLRSARGFYRTDIMFASGNERNPLFVVGTEARTILEEERFRGLEFEAIEP
jgi:rubredoxin